MFRTMQKQWVAGLILVGLAVGTLSLVAHAQEREPQPGDYYLIEFISGSLGALLGVGSAGLLVAAVAYVLFPPLLSCDERCRIAAQWIRDIVFLIAIPVGGTAGVVMAGSYRHVRGNALATFAGAIIGEMVGLSIAFLSIGTLLDPVILPVLALSTALGATLGYNVNATVEPVVLSPTNQGLVLVGLKVRW
ncbi:hypothetical protein HYR54_12945 [Candidatus Acetothermia bacterium]|nr:hypothetical protein [Candidatus Acetothermia bacterium]